MRSGNPDVRGYVHLNGVQGLYRKVLPSGGAPVLLVSMSLGMSTPMPVTENIHQNIHKRSTQEPNKNECSAQKLGWSVLNQ